MEFKSLGNIETSFRQIRLYAFVFAIVCVAVSGYALYASYSFAKEQREKIYAVSYTHLRAHETGAYLVCRLLLES